MHTQKMIASRISYFLTFFPLDFSHIFDAPQHTVAGVHLPRALQHHLAEPTHLASLSELAHGHIHGSQQAGVEHQFPVAHRVPAQAYRRSQGGRLYTVSAKLPYNETTN